MKILIAEDDLVSRRRLEANLKSWNYDVLVVSDGNQANVALQSVAGPRLSSGSVWPFVSVGPQARNGRPSFPGIFGAFLESEAVAERRNSKLTHYPRLAILDWMMPGMDGVRVCQEVRKVQGNPYVYILMLTAKDRKEDVAEGLDAGADDFITKPYDALELRARLRAGRRILALQEGLLQARDALRFQITLDPLTGLLNRTAILAAMKAELVRAEREGAPLAVFKADLDHFSRINEAYGNLAGDAVLRETAKRIRSVGRIYDSVARYGGEEFVVMAPGCDAGAAVQLADRIRTSICGQAMDLSEGMMELTVSVGMATLAGEKGISPESILSAAHLALSRSKERGRNRVELAHIEEVVDMAWAKSQGQVTRLRAQNGR